MPASNVLLIAALLLLAALTTGGVMAYNRLVALRQRCRNAFSQIDVQLSRRHNLVPQLVNTVQGAMRHERETLENVTRARQEAAQALGQLPPNFLQEREMQHLARTENELTLLLAGLMARIEAYPELKAMQNTLLLMEELRSTENRIAFARQAYNDAVARYNSQRDSFPTLLFAGPLGFAHEFFLDLAV